MDYAAWYRKRNLNARLGRWLQCQTYFEFSQPLEYLKRDSFDNSCAILLAMVWYRLYGCT